MRKENRWSHGSIDLVLPALSEVAAFVDFENVFEFDQLVSVMAIAIRREPEGDCSSNFYWISHTELTNHDKLSNCSVFSIRIFIPPDRI
jgi:hypothetical protein